MYEFEGDKMWLLDEHKLRRPEDEEVGPLAALMTPHITARFVTTRRGGRVATMFIASDSPRATIIFAHGNATDIGYSRPHLVDLSRRLRVNVLAYDYTGWVVGFFETLPA